uniref:Methyltransf_11 domain-containing protein n=2 Tax=Ascaris TaxID=6251 RepID=A0A0M3HT19_ASCLU
MGSNLCYKDVAYWNERFASEENFEWLAKWEDFSHLVLPHLKLDDRILHIGCGNSNLSMILYELGFHNITNVDFSSVLIEKFSLAYPHMKWICDDMRGLKRLPTCSFDVIIEKASIESLTVDEKSPWNYSEDAITNIDTVLSGIFRVLAQNGIYFSISFTQPHFRVPLIMRNREWSCCVQEFGHFFQYFCYRMRKGEKPDWNNLQRYFKITANGVNDESICKESIVEHEQGLEVFNGIFDDND